MTFQIKKKWGGTCPYPICMLTLYRMLCVALENNLMILQCKVQTQYKSLLKSQYFYIFGLLKHMDEKMKTVYQTGVGTKVFQVIYRTTYLSIYLYIRQFSRTDFNSLKSVTMGLFTELKIIFWNYSLWTKYRGRSWFWALLN